MTPPKGVNMPKSDDGRLSPLTLLPSADTSPNGSAMTTPAGSMRGSVSDIAVTGSNLERLWFTLGTANNHSIMNKWVNVDETNHFALQMKEKKARLTAQCRIIVKGAKHLPMQVSTGPTIDFLFHTWMYCRGLEELLPKEITRYQDVETWVKNHVRDLIGKARAAADKDKAARRSERDPSSPRGRKDDEAADEESEESDDDQDGEERGVCLVRNAEPTSPTNKSQTGASIAGQSSAPNFGIWKMTMRPQTKEEYKNIEALRHQVRRNRTGLAMLGTLIYTLLMRYLSFDGYFLFLVVLECFVHYVGMNYREIGLMMAKRAGRSRMNRVKDWFFFGIRRKHQRTDDLDAM